VEELDQTKQLAVVAQERQAQLVALEQAHQVAVAVQAHWAAQARRLRLHLQAQPQKDWPQRALALMLWPKKLLGLQPLKV
jgi:hypothetical protein